MEVMRHVQSCGESRGAAGGGRTEDAMTVVDSGDENDHEYRLEVILESRLPTKSAIKAADDFSRPSPNVKISSL